jgi:hypothetical protein
MKSHSMHDLAGEREHAPTLAHCRDALRGWMKQQNDTFESCTWYRDHWTVDRNIIRGAKGGSHDLKALGGTIAKHFPETTE